MGARVGPSCLGPPSLPAPRVVCDGTRSVDFCTLKHLGDAIKITSPPNPRFRIAPMGRKMFSKGINMRKSVIEWGRWYWAMASGPESVFSADRLPGFEAGYSACWVCGLGQVAPPHCSI